MSFFADAFIAIFLLCIFMFVLVISVRLMYCIVLVIYKIFEPCRRYRNRNRINTINRNRNFIDDVTYMAEIERKKCNHIINYLCCCRCNYKKKKQKVKPIYDDVHIIVINPHQNYQIGTISQIVNQKI